MNEPYYIPMTLRDVEEFIHRFIHEHPELDGTEIIVGAKFIEDDDHTVPPGSVLLELKKPDEDDIYGTVALMPKKARILM